MDHGNVSVSQCGERDGRIRCIMCISYDGARAAHRSRQRRPARPRRPGHRRHALHRRDVRPAARPAGRRPRRHRAAGPNRHGPVAAARLRGRGPAGPRRLLGLADPRRAGGVRRAVRTQPARAVPSGAYQGGHFGAAGSSGYRWLSAGGGVLARGTPAAGPGGHPGRAAGAPAGRRGALAGRRHGALGRGMLGDRGRADPQDRHPDDRDHARTAVPDRRLRLPRGRRRRAGRATRHARVLYVCSAAARPTVLRARAALGPLGGRLEIRDLPAQAPLDGPPPAGRERAC